MTANAQELARFGERLRRLRKRRGLSQEDVADALEVTSRTYQRWERGKTSGWRGHLNSLAEILAVTPGVLTGDEPEPRPNAPAPYAESERVAALERQVNDLQAELRTLRLLLLDPETVRREAARLLAQELREKDGRSEDA